MSDSTRIIDRGGRRVRLYKRQNSGRPGQQLRRKMLAAGKKWCSVCATWLDALQVGKNGLCRPHTNEAYRKHYQKSPAAIKTRAARRKKLRLDRMRRLRDQLFEEFEGRCAYCPASADTLDHLVPVQDGGQTRLGNLVPACRSCNSSKRDRPLDLFLAKRSLIHDRLFEALILAEAL